MKRIYWIVLIILTLILTACGGTDASEAVPTVVLDTSATDSEPAASSPQGVVIASAEVHPLDTVNLSFPLLGTITSVEVEVGDQVKAGETVATLDTAILEAQVAEAEANVAAAEAQKALLRRIGSKQDQLDAAQADVDRAQAQAEQVKVRLTQTTLITPMDGTIVTVDAAPGETANPGQVLFTIADLSHMRIETTDLSERDIPLVEIGQSANVFIESLNEVFDGQVVDIDRQSETVGGDVTYKVTIELDQQPQGLRWGMSAEVEIQTEQ